MQLIFNIRKIIICTLVLSFFVAPFPNFTARVAEAATEINYQGKLMTSSNVAVPDGLYNMEFKLYTVSSGGSAIWTETRTGASKVQVTSGLFTVLLGSETSLSGINFDQTIYLGVNIGGTGTPSWDGEMSPRKKFASAPSAFVSDTAKSLDATYATSTNLITTNASTTNLYASSTFTNALTINSYSGLLIGTNGLVSAIATSSLGLLTTNVAEGSNLYFTDQRADARVNAVLSATTSLPNITTLAGLTTAGNLATVGTLTSGSIGSGFGNINIGSNTFTGNGSGLTALNASNISTGVLAIARGGTGTTTAPTFGQLLMGNALGGYDLVATSTLGISSGSGTVNSGTAGQVAFYNSTGTALSGTSTLFFANGNVGVGSTSPIADFSVQGKYFAGAGQKLLSVIGAVSSGSGGGIDLITGGGGHVNIKSQANSDVGSGNINITTETGFEQGGTINVLAGSGQYAPGSIDLTAGDITSDPIERGGSITLNPGSGMSVGQDGYINIASTRGYVGIGTTGVSSARLTIKGLASATSILNIASSTGTTFFSFQSNGRFGIGTTTPSAKLAVTGTAGTEDLFNIASSTNASLFKIGATGATYFNNNAGTLGMVLLSNGTGASPTWVATSSLGISGGGGSGTVNSGTAGQVAFYNSTGTAVSGTSTLFFANGNVGIGTTTPSKLFTIAGEQYVTGTSTLSNIRFASSTFTMSYLNSTTLGDLVFAEGTAGGIKLYAKDNTGASSNIDFRGNNNRVTLTNVDIASAIYSGIQNITTPWLGSTNSSGGDVSWAISKTGNGASQTISALTQVYASSVNGPKLVIGANGIDFAMRDNSAWNEGVDFTAMVIASSTGYVGIGTTTPSAKLAVTGTAGTGDIFNIASSTNASLFKIGATGATYFNNNAGTLGMVLLSNGTGASPTWVATSSLGISGGGGGSGTVNSGLTGQVAFYAADGTAVSGTSTLFFANGNVGIGTTTPGSALTVVGTTTIAGPIRVGMSSNDAVIIGDITGNARGTKAIDIQTRAADTEVASGPTSVAVGYRNRVTGTQGSAFGTENKVDGNYATAVGYYNTANGSKAVALGSENNLGTNLLAIGVGYNNVVSDWYSTAVGYSNTVSAYQSVAVGMNLTNNIAYSYMMGPSQSAAATILSTGEFKAPFFNATSTTGTSTFAGYVGIGTTTPGSLLTVAGNVSITGGITIPVTTSGGLGVVTMGSSRFIHGYGGTQTSVFMGPNAGNLTNTGRDNIGIGSNALVGLTSARLAVAVGSGALERNSSGWSNTAIGESALNFVTTNGNNTAVGRRALYGTTGENNTAIGTQAGESGSSGSNNIYLGYLAGDNLTTGSSNIILGTNIDFASTTASNQLNIGNLIFSQGITGTGTTLSTGNIGIGVSNPAYKLEVNGTSSAQALRLPEFDAGGAGVLFMGSNRFLYGNNGSENTFVGAGAGKLSSPGVANTAVGQGSMINISSGGNYNVALGGTNIRSLTTGDSNIAIGYQTMYDLGTGNNNIAIGRQAGYLITGSNNILLGYQAGKLNSGSTNIVIGYDINAPVGSGSNQLVIGNLIYGTSIDGTNTTVSSGNIGIGTSTPNQKLVVAGTIQATNLLGGSTNLTVDANGNIIRDPSDQGLKENIVTLEGSLAKIEQLRGVRYEWKDKLRFGSSSEIGVIAQEVELVVPEVVSSGGVYKSVNIKNLVALLIEGVKELKVQVDVVKEKVVAISAWFGSDGDRLNVKGQICVDDVCVTKDQFKQILINSGSVMSQPASSGSAGGGTGPGVESGTGTNSSETPSDETGSGAPVNGGAEETGDSSGAGTASSDEVATPSGATESTPTTEPTTPPVVSTPPAESVVVEPAPAPSPAPTE